ncbi:hypothetical protein F5148DRAFT_1220241 [Russula earlei]|uniref:Uncharacterized protein n=1 Tax=Russula earlei TaxID=71964 RepID=A0ACC0U495_9AGAM|nr:hypothetical protein F5148DRAFT_1220241 [Russula earlei]
MYMVWWDKPLHVQRGVRVYKKRKTKRPMDDEGVEAICSIGPREALREFFKLPAAIVRGPLTTDRQYHKWPWLPRVLLWPFLKPMRILFGAPIQDEDLKRVDTFYPNKWSKDSGFSYVFLLFIIPIFASAFGGIHCIGWSFVFLSSAERSLWRVASASITIIPILLLLVMSAWESRGRWIANSPWYNTFSLGLTQYILVIVYMLSRLVLLVLPVLSLRSLPSAIYNVVHWTSFIPHV